MEKINDRIRKIRDKFADSNNQSFAKMLGYSPQFTSGLCNNDSVGNKVTDHLLDVFPTLSKVWLLTGEGPMLKVDSQERQNATVNGNGNIVTNGHDNKVSPPCTKVEELYEARLQDKDSLIASLQDRVSHQATVIDRLTTAISTLTAALAPK